MDDSVEIHAPEDSLQLSPSKRKSDGSSKTKKAKTATGSGSKAAEADSSRRPSRSRVQKKTVSSSVSVVGRPRSNSVSGTKGSERHRSQRGSHHSSRHDSGCREWGVGPAHIVGRVQLQETGWLDGYSGVEPCLIEGDGCPAFGVFHSFSSPSSQDISWSSSRSWKTWKFGEVWIILRLQTWGTAVPSVVTIAREKNHHCDSIADPIWRHWWIGRCDGSSRGWRAGNSDGWDGCCGRPSRLRPSRWQPSRWRVCRGAHHGSRWRARDNGRPSKSCRPSTPSAAGRWRPSPWCWRPGRCGRPSTPSGSGSGWPSKDG